MRKDIICMCIKKKVQTLSFIRMCCSLLVQECGKHVASAFFSTRFSARTERSARELCYMAREVVEKEGGKDQLQENFLLI